MERIKRSGIAISLTISGALFSFLLTDSWIINHGFISGCADYVAEPHAWVIGMAFFMLALPLSDPFLRAIATKIKPEVSLKSWLHNLKTNAELLTKLEAQIREIELLLPESNEIERRNSRKKGRVILNRMHTAMEHADKDLSEVEGIFQKFKKTINEDRRKFTDESD